MSSEVRRLGPLVDRWLQPLYRAHPDVVASHLAEIRLHAAIKAGPYYGMILSFAGLNLWVDTRTPDGFVMSQEVINL